jgi:hypothetical protein
VRGSSFRPLGGALCLLLLATCPVFAQEDPVQAAREDLVLIPQGASARLELPGGRTLRVALPERAEASSLAATETGWVAAGSTAEAGGGGRQHLFLLTGNDKTYGPLPEPPNQLGARRRAPVLLVDGGRLAGLAWLEGDGDRTLAVRAAAWTGKRWQAASWVSQPGPGSQLALTGAVLGDGSWLLAWSAFDGTADEIVWSRRVGRDWSPVSRVSAPNAVPDITPALTATAGGGALLAWSRYDGHGYQLRLARFGRGEWQAERAAAASGSLYPAFVGGPDRPRLVYMEARPRAWSVLDLDGAGRIRAKASVTSPSAERPVVTSTGGGGIGARVRMRWVASRREGVATLEKVP